MQRRRSFDLSSPFGALHSLGEPRLGEGLVDQLLQFLAWLEVWDLLRRHVHLLSRLGVASRTGLAAAKAEAAEAAELDLLAGAKRFNDRVKDDVDDGLGLFLGELDCARDFVDQFGLRHHSRFRALWALFAVVEFLVRQRCLLPSCGLLLLVGGSIFRRTVVVGVRRSIAARAELRAL